MATKSASEKKSSAMRKARKSTAVPKGSFLGATSPKTINYRFDNGMEINGTIEQIEKVASTMGLKVDYKKFPKGYRPLGMYLSSTKGMIKISGMNDFHIRRALLKEAKEYYGEMYSSDDSNTEFLHKFIGLAEIPVVAELFAELANRK